MECPDPSCREELKKEMTNFVKSSTVYAVIVILVTIILGLSSGVYLAYSGGQLKQDEAIEKTQKSHENCQRSISGLKTDVEVIKNKLEEVEKKVNKSEDIQFEMLRILNKLETRSDEHPR
jgi:peptidoglycan hydrolase CwlO-like protein